MSSTRDTPELCALWLWLAWRAASVCVRVRACRLLCAMCYVQEPPPNIYTYTYTYVTYVHAIHYTPYTYPPPRSRISRQTTHRSSKSIKNLKRLSINQSIQNPRREPPMSTREATFQHHHTSSKPRCREATQAWGAKSESRKRKLARHSLNICICTLFQAKEKEKPHLWSLMHIYQRFWSATQTRATYGGLCGMPACGQVANLVTKSK